MRQLVSVLWLMGMAALMPLQAAEPAFMAPLAAKARLYDLADGVAVGERGIVLKAVDGNWQQQPAPVRTALLRVVKQGDSRWLLGHEATLLRQQGEQLTIVTTSAGSDRPLFDVQFVDDRRGYAVGAYGLMLQTLDGGASWQSRQLLELLNEDDRAFLAELQAEDPEGYAAELETILPHFNAIAGNGSGALVIVGEAGLVVMSRDNGDSWQPLDSPYEGSFFTALWVNPDTLLVAGLRGHLYRYELMANRWTAIPVKGERHINRLQPLDGERVLALGNAGQITVVEWASGQVHTDMVSDGPDLFAATVAGNLLTLASSAGLIQHQLVTPEVK